MKKNSVSDALRSALDRRCAPWVRVLLTMAAALVFYGFAINARYAKLDEFIFDEIPRLTQITAILFTAIFAAAAAVQMRAGRRLPLYALLLLLTATGAMLLGKISLLDYLSDDYDIFLQHWIDSYTGMTIREGLGTYIGSDYSPPYLYLLLLISRCPSGPYMYMVKAVSVAFDVLLAYAVMKLSSLRMKGEAGPLLMFHIASILPTVVFNSAYWGQCDGIYTSFCLLALYLILRGKPARGMACFGVALSFKLQTVFFLPVLLPLWLRREIKLRHVLLIPAAYMGMMLPALWGGKSLHHVLTVYLQQAGNYSFITVNAPTLYQFLPQSMDLNMLYDMFGGMAMMLGFAMMLLVCVLVCWRRERLTQQSVLLACVLSLSGIPFFMPKMHERYTFGADVLSLVLAVYDPRQIVLPLCFGLASYICYTEGLPGEPVMSLKWASMFQLAGIVMTARLLVRQLNESTKAQLTEVKS